MIKVSWDWEVPALLPVTGKENKERLEHMIVEGDIYYQALNPNVINTRVTLFDFPICVFCRLETHRTNHLHEE